MWRSSGLQAAEFASLLDPFVNVSTLFRRRQHTPSSHVASACKLTYAKAERKQSSAQRRCIAFCCCSPSGQTEEGPVEVLLTLSFRLTVQLPCLVLQALFSLQSLSRGAHKVLKQQQQEQVAVIAGNPQEATRHRTVNTLCELWPVYSE